MAVWRSRLFVKLHLMRIHNVFRKYSFEACRGYIEEALDQCKSNDIEFVPFRLRQYVLGNRFTNANVDMVQYLEDVEGNVRDPVSVTKEEIEHGSVFTGSVKFSSLFHKGFECLQKDYGGNGLELIERNELLDFAVQSFVYGFLLKKGVYSDTNQGPFALSTSSSWVCSPESIRS